MSQSRVFPGSYFPYFEWMRKLTLSVSVFSKNIRKCGPGKTPHLDSFNVVLLLRYRILKICMRICKYLCFIILSLPIKERIWKNVMHNFL